MSVILPFNRRDYVLRPSVSLWPLPARAAAEPSMAVAAREWGLDMGAVRWNGGLTLLAAADGLCAAVQARADTPDQVTQLYLISPSAGAVSEPGQHGSVSLRLRVPRSHMVAAIARHVDGSLTGALAEVRMTV